jgi:hypothetical protein
MGKSKLGKQVTQRCISTGFMKVGELTGHLLGSYTCSIAPFKTEQGYILGRFYCSDQRMVEWMNLTPRGFVDVCAPAS